MEKKKKQRVRIIQTLAIRKEEQTDQATRQSDWLRGHRNAGRTAKLLASISRVPVICSYTLETNYLKSRTILLSSLTTIVNHTTAIDFTISSLLFYCRNFSTQSFYLKCCLQLDFRRVNVVGNYSGTSRHKVFTLVKDKVQIYSSAPLKRPSLSPPILGFGTIPARLFHLYATGGR